MEQLTNGGEAAGASMSSAQAVWDAFCDRLKGAGALLEHAGTPRDEQTQAEGLRYLTRAVRIGLQYGVDQSNPLAPELYRHIDATTKFAADNPDQIYMSAAIDGTGTYRISGTLGTCPLFEFTVYTGRRDIDPGGGRVLAFATEGDLDAAPGEQFELILSPQPHRGNWLETQPDARLLYFRQYITDRARQKPANLVIERLGTVPPTPLTIAEVRSGFDRALGYALTKTRTYVDYVDELKASRRNQLLPAPGAEQRGGPGGLQFAIGYFDLEPDEMLIVEFDAPEVPYWGLQLTNYWWESLDYRFRRVSINNLQLAHRDDGKVRVAVAATDPGVGTWLDTDGRREGTLVFRWARSDAPVPRFDTRVEPIR